MPVTRHGRQPRSNVGEATSSNPHIGERTKLTTRQERIDDFIHEGSPPNDQPLQILCEDHVGTYVIPFPSRWRGGIWENAKTSRRIEATVVGWRERSKLSAEPSDFQLKSCLYPKPPRIQRPVPH